MAQLAKALLCKHEDLSRGTRTCVKSQVSWRLRDHTGSLVRMYMYHPSAGELETGGTLGLSCQPT